MTRRACALLTVASVLFASALRTAAEAAPVHPGLAQYAKASAAWAACFPKDAPVELPPAASADDLGTSLDVTRVGTHFRIAGSWGGSGSDAVYGGTTVDFEPGTCATLWARTFTYDGAFARQFRIGWAKRGAPSERELTSLVAAPAILHAPAFAMARAWLDHSCDGSPESTLEWSPGALLAGPVAPAQAWLAGVPTASPDSFWSSDALHSIGARASLEVDLADDNEMMPRLPSDRLVGVVVPGLAAPTRTFNVGTIEIREAEMPGRNGGRAIALYDRAKNRHRWVLLTRGCIQGSTVQWLGAIGARAIGVTSSQHGRYARGDAIVVLDTAAGIAWAVKFPAATTEDGFDHARATLAGSTITFGTGKATAAIDLAPALAELPISAP
jgi:hypothetical protein